MKRIIVLILLLLTLVFDLFADDSSLVEKRTLERVLTAYKSKKLDSVPEYDVHVRFLDSDSTELGNGTDVEMPLSARNASYKAFSWVLSGNAYGIVYLTFSFAPMYLQESTTTFIPYTVSLSHTTSRLGNAQISVGTASTAAHATKCSFSDSYYFKYADSVEFTGNSVTVNAAGQQKSIKATYSMNTYTSIKTSNGVDVKSSYPYDVCDYWNRYGEAVVSMSITEAGYVVGSNNVPYENGVYYAAVVVEISKP